MKTLLLVFLVSSFVWAKQTSYLNYEEPPGWKCELSTQGVFFCESPKEEQREESLILIFGAPATENDTFPNYEQYLNKTKTILDESGKTVESKVTFVRRRNINGFEWIDSLQQNSEISGCWTRYLATVQKPLAILVTYVVCDKFYTELTPAFERMVASLKPVSDFKFSENRKDLALPGTELGSVLKSHFEKKLSKKNTAQPELPKPGQSSSPLLYVIIGILIGGVVLMRAKKKTQKSKKA
jgi:hypothetical protein